MDGLVTDISSEHAEVGYRNLGPTLQSFHDIDLRHPGLLIGDRFLAVEEVVDLRSRQYPLLLQHLGPGCPWQVSELVVRPLRQQDMYSL